MTTDGMSALIAEFDKIVSWIGHLLLLSEDELDYFVSLLRVPSNDNKCCLQGRVPFKISKMMQRVLLGGNTFTTI